MATRDSNRQRRSCGGIQLKDTRKEIKAVKREMMGVKMKGNERL